MYLKCVLLRLQCSGFIFVVSLYFQAVVVKGEAKGNQGKLLDWIILGFGKIFYQITGGGENDLMSTPTSSVWGLFLFYIFCVSLKYFRLKQELSK